MKKLFLFPLFFLLTIAPAWAMEKQDIFPNERLPRDLSKIIAADAGILTTDAKGFFSGSSTQANGVPIDFIDFSSSSKSGFFINEGGGICLVDPNNQAQHYIIQNVHFGSLSPDSKRLIIVFNDKTAQLIDLSNNQVIVHYQNVRYIDSYSDSYLSLKFSPDSKRLFIPFDDKTAQLIDLTDNQVIASYQNVYNGSFSPDSKKLSIVFYDGTAQLIDLSNNQVIAHYQNVFYLHTPQFSPDSKKLLIIVNSTAHLIDLTDNQVIASYQNVDITCNSIARFSPDSKKLFIKCTIRIAQLIDLNLLNHLNNYLTVEQALFLQQLYTDLSNDKIPNKDEHGEMIWQSLPQELQQIIQHKINEIVQKRNQNNNNNA